MLRVRYHSGMVIAMTLTEYLTENDMTLAEFASRIGVDPVTVYRYTAGDRFPRRTVMVRIFRETGGKVTPNDWFLGPANRRQKKVRAAENAAA